MAAFDRRRILALAGATLALSSLPQPRRVLAGSALSLKVYKSPLCGCCGAWVKHIEAKGFDVDVFEMEDLAPVKAHYRVGPNLQSCHTAVIDGYVIEGHVPAADIQRLILERPVARGLAVPGMPIGSPGMEQADQKEPYDVVLFGDEGVQVFTEYR
jgi:hypothetical protein